MRKKKLFVIMALAIGMIIFLGIRHLDIAGIEELFDEHIQSLTIDITALLFTFCGLIFAGTQLKNSKNLNESQFLMQLNSEFINNKELLSIENKLERYYINPSSVYDIEKDWESGSKARQSLIDYLVFFEGLSVSVQKHIIKIDFIDDLFTYRFFLAFHNPIVQKTELTKYPQYYRGCFVLYLLSEVWLKRWLRWNRSYPTLESQSFGKPEIPMMENALYNNNCMEFIRWNKPFLRRKINKVKRMVQRIKEQNCGGIKKCSEKGSIRSAVE